MPSYRQYCPVARGAEIFAERWTPIILRNVLFGCDTFNDLAAGAPGLSRALLVRRLGELERAGLIETRPKPNGHGSLYLPTAAGRAIEPVIVELGLWAEQWTDVRPDDADPAVVIWSWAKLYLARDALPTRRVVVRFEFQRIDCRQRLWLVVDKLDTEVCAFDPGFGDDLVVSISDPVAFARWNLGHLSWSALLKSGAATIEGPTQLRRALPTWTTRPQIGFQMQSMIEARAAAPPSR